SLGWVVVLLVPLLSACATVTRADSVKNPDAPVPVNPAPFDGAIRVPVGDVTLEGTLYAAAGMSSHPTLIWFDASPAPVEALRAAGLNVLRFHDLAGTDGCEAARAARAYLKSPEVARYYRVDADAIVSTD